MFTDIDWTNRQSARLNKRLTADPGIRNGCAVKAA
jgi:hypothetical protein